MFKALLLVLLLAATAHAQPCWVENPYATYTYVTNTGRVGTFTATVSPNGRTFHTFIPSPAFQKQPPKPRPKIYAPVQGAKPYEPYPRASKWFPR